MFGEAKPHESSETTKDRKDINTFRRIHERLGYSEAHRLKDLHLFAEEVEIVTSPAYFQCDICDQSKIS